MKPFDNPYTAYAADLARFADLARIAVRFTLVEKSDESAVVGLLGSTRYKDLNDTQLRQIAHFYGMEPDPHEYLTSYPIELNETMYTGFIRFTAKGEIK